MPHFTNVVDGATIKTQQYTLRRKKGFIMNHDITNEVLTEFSTAFSSNPVNRIAMNAVTFELSQNYTLFYDKLEKSNYFLESILETLDESTQGRLISFLLSAPLGDGGQWDMLCNLVRKYGVVPKEAMPETVSSSATREMTSALTRFMHLPWRTSKDF